MFPSLKSLVVTYLVDSYQYYEKSLPSLPLDCFLLLEEELNSRVQQYILGRDERRFFEILGSRMVVPFAYNCLTHVILNLTPGTHFFKSSTTFRVYEDWYAVLFAEGTRDDIYIHEKTTGYLVRQIHCLLLPGEIMVMEQKGTEGFASDYFCPENIIEITPGEKIEKIQIMDDLGIYYDHRRHTLW